MGHSRPVVGGAVTFDVRYLGVSKQRDRDHVPSGQVNQGITGRWWKMNVILAERKQLALCDFLWYRLVNIRVPEHWPDLTYTARFELI